MKKSIYSKNNPNYKENILSLILSKNKNVKMLNADVRRKSGKSRMIISMVDENGHKFEKTLENVKHDKYLCCKICARKLLDEDNYKKREKEWIKIIKLNGYKILEMPSHITTDSIICIEDKEGYKYEVNARSVKDNRNLLKFGRYTNRKYTIYNLNIYKIKNNLLSEPIEIIDSLSNCNNHIYCKFKCKCGKYFNRSINKWMMGKDLCISCSQSESSFEKVLKKYLDKNNIQYKMEFTINECRKINPLPFDFWLKDFNCLIEIDGQQHYMPVDYGVGEEKSKIRFLQQKENDKIKDEYCKKYKIPLLRIPYWDFKDNAWIITLNDFLNSLRINDS